MIWHRIKVFLFGTSFKRRRELEDLQAKCAPLAAVLHREKERLRIALEPDLFVFVSEVVDPLLRAFQTNMTRGGGLEEKIVRLTQWLPRAEKTVRLLAQSDHPQRFKEKLVALLVNRTYQAIDQDLQILKDYRRHALNRLTPHHKVKVKETLVSELTPHLEKLEQLKKSKTEVSLATIKEWSHQINKKRSRLVDHAFEMIDSYTQ